MARFLNERARELRRAQTPAEQMLWHWLRRGRLGVKFRRQHPLALFIFDFYCVEARLAVEADGAHHYPPPRSDIARDAMLQAADILVLRYENRVILATPIEVVKEIRFWAVLRQACRDQSPLPSPSGRGAGGEGLPSGRGAGGEGQ